MSSNQQVKSHAIKKSLHLTLKIEDCTSPIMKPRCAVLQLCAFINCNSGGIMEGIDGELGKIEVH
jgi:hypothetical protein